MVFGFLVIFIAVAIVGHATKSTLPATGWLMAAAGIAGAAAGMPAAAALLLAAPGVLLAASHAQSPRRVGVTLLAAALAMAVYGANGASVAIAAALGGIIALAGGTAHAAPPTATDEPDPYPASTAR